ncbi:MAG: cytochrome c-related protein [Acidobacteria bacterium]|nr:cytochrome c-related protein [Acidobacteriota bacterium]
MKTFLKIVGGVVLVVLALVLGGVSYLSMRKPAQRPASAEKIESTPARLARGSYLVNHVSDCLGCHSDHIDGFAFPVKPGAEGQGGFVFDKKLGFPGVVAAQNITSDPETGLGKWTDGEILRAIREGVDRNGDALFPMMPYTHLRNLGDEDAKSIVVYLRTLKPVRNQVVAKRIDFPVNLFVKFAPQPLDGPVSAPDPHDSLKYGKYLTTIAGCYECHTPHDDKNGLIADKPFSGGWEMRGPWGRVLTANLTPHPDNYLGRATKAEFIGRFRAFASIDPLHPPVAAKGRNTVMPWLAFAQMTDNDLGAIYDYLKTVKPIANRVNSFPDAR